MGKAKNPNGAGSEYRRSKEKSDGRWVATYYAGEDANGRPSRREATGVTKAAAVARRAAALERLGATGPAKFTSKSTVGELAAWWLDTIARHRVRASSFGRYEDRVRRIVDTIGSIPAVELRPEQVNAWQSDLLASGLATKTVADARVVLRQVLAAAVDYDVVPTNVVDRVKAPKVVTRPSRALTADDARALILAACDDRYGAAVALLFVHGWRVSEVLGLAWGDIDFKAGTATVRRAAVYVDGKGTVLGKPKTEGAHGTHHLAPGVLAALKDRRTRQKAERIAAADWMTHTYEGEPVDLVFTTLTGGVVGRQAVVKVMQKAALVAGIDPVGLGTHVGRRTVVTTLYGAAGIDLADVARHVGHSSPTTTAGYVRHLGDRPRLTSEAAASRLDIGP